MRKIEIEYSDGPVSVKANTDQKGIDNEIPYKQGIQIRELFPSNVKESYYRLILSKAIEGEENIQSAQNELEAVLRLLCYIWPYAGGSCIRFSKEHITYTNLYRSNIQQLENEILEEKGKIEVTSTMAMGLCVCGTYRTFPLQNAMKILKETDEDAILGEILRYHYQARVNREGWFIDLYKIKDKLLEKYNNNIRACRNSLGIDDKDWGYFEKILDNYDLRHPGNIKKPHEALDPDDRKRLFALADLWIRSYMDVWGK